MKIIFVNILHGIGIFLPIVFLVLPNSSVESISWCVLIASFLIAISMLTSYLFCLVKIGEGVLKFSLSPDIDNVSKEAGKLYFSGLFFIPHHGLLPISKSAWSTAVKINAANVETYLKVSRDILYFVISFIAMIGIYMALSLDFGIALSKLVDFFDVRKIVGLVLLPASTWIVIVFSFNGFVRFFQFWVSDNEQ